MQSMVAVDLGGTSVKGARFLKGELCARAARPTDVSRGRDGIVETLASVIDALLQDGDAGIAVSTAGDVDPFAGRVVYATENLPGFTGFEIAAYVSARYGLPCRALNDAHAALLGELRYGGGKGFARCAMLTLGTGVGGAYYNNGLQLGEDFRAYRLGHVCLRENGLACNCGRRGCIEQYVSATALVGRMAGGPYADARELFSAFAAKEAAAERIVLPYLGDLADAVMAVKAEADFDCLLLGGGIAGSAELFLPALQALLPASVNVAAAQLGNDAGLYGARYFFERGKLV